MVFYKVVFAGATELTRMDDQWYIVKSYTIDSLPYIYPIAENYRRFLISSICSATSWPDFVRVRSLSLPCFSKLMRPDFCISCKIFTT